MLKFLTHLFDSGLSYSAINTARSALSALSSAASADHTIGSHPSVVRFMKGIFELRTPTPRYSSMWDVSVVLDHLKKLGKNSALTFKQLTFKLCALLLLATAQRVQTIHAIRCTEISINDKECIIRIVDRLKHTRQRGKGCVLLLQRYKEEPLLCVVETLVEYMKRTDKLRKNTEKLLLCYAKPHGEASKESVARWMKAVLRNAKIMDFTAHSFRSASSSAMLDSGVPIDHVLKSAGWSNANTFYKFYYRPSRSTEDQEKAKAKSGQSSLLRYFSKEKD